MVSLLGGYDLCVMTAAPLPKRALPKAEQLRLEEELVKTRAAKMKKLNEDFQAVGIFTQSMLSFSAFF